MTKMEGASEEISGLHILTTPSFQFIHEYSQIIYNIVIKMSEIDANHFISSYSLDSKWKKSFVSNF